LVLKQQLHNNVLNTPNAAAESCVAQLRKEIDNLKAREAEAAEQVQKSVKVAEQIRQQKTEAEFEIGQLSSQVERQQVRIRSLIEEQVCKVEEERGDLFILIKFIIIIVIMIKVLIEKRNKDQMENIRKELQTSLQETGRLSAVSEKLGRSENELKKQIEEKEKTVNQVMFRKRTRII
jgi:hypothetical protein